ncbi:MAG: hypothetical protein ABIH41_03790 [Nanoarchaeota archaeon]
MAQEVINQKAATLRARTSSQTARQMVEQLIAASRINPQGDVAKDASGFDLVDKHYVSLFEKYTAMYYEKVLAFDQLKPTNDKTLHRRMLTKIVNALSIQTDILKQFKFAAQEEELEKRLVAVIRNDYAKLGPFLKKASVQSVQITRRLVDALKKERGELRNFIKGLKENLAQQTTACRKLLDDPLKVDEKRPAVRDLLAKEDLLREGIDLHFARIIDDEAKEIAEHIGIGVLHEMQDRIVLVYGPAMIGTQDVPNPNRMKYVERNLDESRSASFWFEHAGQIWLLKRAAFLGRLRSETIGTTLFKVAGLPVAETYAVQDRHGRNFTISKRLEGYRQFLKMLNQFSQQIGSPTMRHFIEAHRFILVALLDTIINNFDRHAGNIMYNEDTGRFAFIDFDGADPDAEEEKQGIDDIRIPELVVEILGHSASTYKDNPRYAEFTKFFDECIAGMGYVLLRADHPEGATVKKYLSMHGFEDSRKSIIRARPGVEPIPVFFKDIRDLHEFRTMFGIDIYYPDFELFRKKMTDEVIRDAVDYAFRLAPSIDAMANDPILGPLTRTIRDPQARDIANIIRQNRDRLSLEFFQKVSPSRRAA